MEDLIVSGFGLFVSVFVAIYFWLLISKIKRFARYHKSIRVHKTRIPSYLIFIVSLVGVVFSLFKMVISFL